MALTPGVHNGFWNSWLDYDSAWQRRMTVTETKAGFISATIVVLLALATPAAYIILVRGISRTWAWSERLYRQRQLRLEGARRQNPDIPEQVVEDESTPLRPRLPRPSYQARIRETWKLSTTPDFALIKLWQLGTEMLTHGPEELVDPDTLPVDFERSPNSVGEYYTGFKKSNLRARIYEITLLVFFWFFCLATFGLLIWGTIASGNILTDSIARSEGKNCGFWIPDSSAPTKENGTNGYFYLQQEEAAEYAKKCYGAPADSNGCNFFVSQDLPYTETDNVLCPFSEELCLNGRFSAFTMSTPLLSSKVLGINVPVGYLFNRTTTCAPIKRDGYVEDTGERYEYQYGPIIEKSNWTWTSPKQLPQTVVPGYDVSTICYEEGSSNYWSPIPAFSVRQYDVTTLLLIQSHTNYHRFPNLDPIFPSTTPLSPPLKKLPLYFNSDPIATTLTCVDQLSVCTHDGKICWTDINNPLSELDNHLEKTGYYMLNIALQRSNICNSISMRGGSALDATTKVPTSLTYPISLPLSPHQWKIESKLLFETSLARIQIDLRDHMLGTAANAIGFANHIDSAFTNMCKMYKMKTVGWRNINTWAFVWLLLLVVCVYVLSWETEWWGQEPELIAESLWGGTVLKFLNWMGWMPDEVNEALEVNGAVVHEDGRHTGAERNDAVGSVGPVYVVGDDESDYS